jgi:hypothetical protein
MRMVWPFLWVDKTDYLTGLSQPEKCTRQRKKYVDATIKDVIVITITG